MTARSCLAGPDDGDIKYSGSQLQSSLWKPLAQRAVNRAGTIRKYPGCRPTHAPSLKKTFLSVSSTILRQNVRRRAMMQITGRRYHGSLARQQSKELQLMFITVRHFCVCSSHYCNQFVKTREACYFLTSSPRTQTRVLTVHPRPCGYHVPSRRIITLLDNLVFFAS